MAKKCLSKTECTRNADSHGYCWGHQYERTDEKWIATLEKIKQKVIVPIKRTYKVTGKLALFNYLISIRPHVSWLTEIPIKHIDHNNCAHVVPAGDPEYKKYCELDPENIIFLTHCTESDEHTLLDQGTNEQRMEYMIRCEEKDIKCNWNRIWDKKKELIAKYKRMKEEDELRN